MFSEQKVIVCATKQEEGVGQDEIRKVLRNYIMLDSVNHANLKDILHEMRAVRFLRMM